MNKYTVHLLSVAETPVHVEAEDVDEAIDKACNQASPQLCHQCAHRVGLGDVWEPSAVFNETGELVWRDEDPT